jgi:hypothetical protein
VVSERNARGCPWTVPFRWRAVRLLEPLTTPVLLAHGCAVVAAYATDRSTARFGRSEELGVGGYRSSWSTWSGGWSCGGRRPRPPKCEAAREVLVVGTWPDNSNRVSHIIRKVTTLVQPSEPNTGGYRGWLGSLTGDRAYSGDLGRIPGRAATALDILERILGARTHRVVGNRCAAVRPCGNRPRQTAARPGSAGAAQFIR